ncbi:hypothetical protein FRC05_004555 [Tulasnella sp. 425]|nr:hypothetical protein FRC05_004555 [Tulasnella sp. 425]
MAACSTECFTKADPSPCKENDVACLCLDTYYFNQVSECVKSCCSEDDAKKAEEAAIKECKAAGIDLANPFPECGAPCVLNTPSYCDENNKDDDKCYCTDDKYIKAVASCTKEYCQGDDFDKAKFVGEARCRAVGVDISSIDGSSW